MNRWLPRTYLTLVYLLLYVPIVVLGVFSFGPLARACRHGREGSCRGDRRGVRKS